MDLHFCMEIGFPDLPRSIHVCILNLLHTPTVSCINFPQANCALFPANVYLRAICCCEFDFLCQLCAHTYAIKNVLADFFFSEF